MRLKECVVDVVRNNEAAFELNLERSFNVAIIDQRLPGSSGREGVGHLKKKKLHLPVLLAKTFSLEREKISGDLASDHAFQFLEKPFEVEVLLKTLSALRQP